MQTNIHFIRHGNTIGTQNKIFYGSTDLPLTEEGRKEVAKLRKQEIYPIIDNAFFYTSGMLRTEQTFEIIYGNKKHGVLSDFRELNLGDLEMTPIEEMNKNFETMQWIKNGRREYNFPNGENNIQFEKRLNNGIRTLRGIKGSGETTDIILICHGAVITATMNMLLPGVMNEYWEWLPRPARGYTVTLENGEPIDCKKISE